MPSSVFEFVVLLVKELNFFDLTGDKSKTKGTSSKFYHIELQLSKQGQAQIHTSYGPTGFVQAREYRVFSSQVEAEKEFHKILKSKIKKGYHEIDVAQRAYGSDEAKAITKPVAFKNVEDVSKPKSSLHKETQYLVDKLFSGTSTFITQTLKCPLGQLTNNQIDAGRNCLEEAKKLLNGTKNARKEVERLTNDFYSLIPHNLGQGARGRLEHLLLDSALKIAQKEQDLDDLLDAKSVGVQLVSNDVEAKYKSLSSGIEFVPVDSYDFQWVQGMMEGTKAKNHHHLGKIVLLKLWKVTRHNEEKYFLQTSERLASEYGKQIVPDVLKKYVIERPPSDLDALYKRANTLPLWHGTRASSLIGILKSGLLIRPSGAVITGAMYGNNLYFGYCSKSVNYTNIQSSYWANGKDETAFMFLLDTSLGNQKIANGSFQYTKENIKPCHSIWAKGGYSGVINDEFMLPEPSGPNQQHCIRYIVEFTCRR